MARVVYKYSEFQVFRWNVTEHIVLSTKMQKYTEGKLVFCRAYWFENAV